MAKKKKKKTYSNLIPSIKEEKNIIPIPKDKTEDFLRIVNQKIVFTFKNDYIHKKCELAYLNETKARCLINKLANVSDIEKINIHKYPNIIRKVLPCEHNNEYKQLFCNKTFEQFENDFYEIDYGDTNRVFGYFIDTTFHIVLIKSRHLKIDKK